MRRWPFGGKARNDTQKQLGRRSRSLPHLILREEWQGSLFSRKGCPQYLILQQSELGCYLRSSKGYSKKLWNCVFERSGLPYSHRAGKVIFIFIFWISIYFMVTVYLPSCQRHYEEREEIHTSMCPCGRGKGVMMMNPYRLWNFDLKW